MLFQGLRPAGHWHQQPSGFSSCWGLGWCETMHWTLWDRCVNQLGHVNPYWGCMLSRGQHHVGLSSFWPILGPCCTCFWQFWRASAEGWTVGLLLGALISSWAVSRSRFGNQFFFEGIDEPLDHDSRSVSANMIALAQTCLRWMISTLVLTYACNGFLNSHELYK